MDLIKLTDSASVSKGQSRLRPGTPQPQTASVRLFLAGCGWHCWYELAYSGVCTRT